MIWVCICNIMEFIHAKLTYICAADRDDKQVCSQAVGCVVLLFSKSSLGVLGL